MEDDWVNRPGACEPASREQQVELYKSIVKPVETPGLGTSMAKVVAKIHAKDSKLLAQLTQRAEYTPGGCGIPHDVRLVVANIHNIAYPQSETYRNYGDARVRRMNKSPKINMDSYRNGKTASGYARGWAVRGYICIE